MLYIIAKLRKNGSGRILKWKKEYELFLNLFLIVSKSGTGAAGFAFLLRGAMTTYCATTGFATFTESWTAEPRRLSNI